MSRSYVAKMRGLRAALAAIALGAGVLAAACGSGSAQPAMTQGAGIGVLPNVPGADTCSKQRSTAGFLVQLRDGAGAPTIATNGDGIRALFLREPNAALAAKGFDRLYVANTADRHALPSSTESVAPLYLQAGDSALHSCDFRLNDPPPATKLRDRASAYLLANGLTTPDWLSDLATQWYVSEDLPGGVVAVYTLLQAPSSPALPNGARDVMMTAFESKDGAIIGSAKVNLYAAFPDAPPPLPPDAHPASVPTTGATR